MGEEATCSFEITVYEAPDADLSADSGIVTQFPAANTTYPTCGYPNVTAFNFTDLTTGGVGNYTWNWNFGDGGNSTQQNPSHIYNATGNYTVNLTVTDSLLGSDTETKEGYIQVYEVGDATANGIINVGDVVAVENMILGLQPMTLWADANQDGKVNVLDITIIERIILGLPLEP